MTFNKQFTRMIAPGLLMLVSSCIFWNQLPEQLPIHLNIRGLADGFSTKGRVLGSLILTYFAIVVFFAAFEGLSQKLYSSRSGAPSSRFLFAIGLFFLFLQSNVIAYGLGFSQQGFAMDQLALGIVLIILGMLVRNLDRNRWLGIRLPWTLASDSNWKATHELLGMLLTATGYLSILISPWIHNAALALYAGILSTIIAILYSFILALFSKARR